MNDNETQNHILEYIINSYEEKSIYVRVIFDKSFFKYNTKRIIYTIIKIDNNTQMKKNQVLSIL